MSNCVVRQIVKNLMSLFMGRV